MAPAIKLIYFNFKGRAEPTRLALHVGGVEFEDERIDPTSFPDMKQTLTFGSLPVITVDGDMYAESGAMLRYAGQLSGLYPKCPKAAMKVDMVVDALETVVVQLFKDKSKDVREKFVAETIPRYVGPMDKFYADSKGPFLLGDEMSIADLKLKVVFDGLNEGKQFDHVPAGVLDQYPHVLGARKAVSEHEKVKDWESQHA